ncbi:MAG: squalene/phytoene synthase family protein [Thermoanaerobaculia bacterium]
MTDSTQVADPPPWIEDLLEGSSRTFALSIPYLPQPTRQEVSIAYLLFRIADTFEDSASWSRRQRIKALDVFCDLLAKPRPSKIKLLALRWTAAVPIDHHGYQQLMAAAPAVLDAFFDLRPAARELIREHMAHTAQGMKGFVDRTDDGGRLDLKDLDDLRQYCYVVAGIVGEMLTELFLLERRGLEPVAAALRARSRLFGEALQLVNILKDSAFDTTEGRSYLPAAVGRSQVFDLARRDLEASAEYVLTLQQAGADHGLVAFNAINALLAFATLERVETEGPGSKISRDDVFRIVALVEKALEDCRPVIDADSPDGTPSSPSEV